MDEGALEQVMLDWLQALGYTCIHGQDISPDSIAPERDSYEEVVLKERLHQSLRRINPSVPTEAIDEAVLKILRHQHPDLLRNNHDFHRYIIQGVDVQVRQQDGSHRTEKVWLFDKRDIENNDFLAVNQFTVIENKHTRRPDIVLFVNGLPLVVIELKKPGNEHANLDAAWNQLQTYKSNIPSLLVYNSFLVISDGLMAKAGSLTADLDRYTFWKTSDGIDKDYPVKPQLETLTLGLLNRETLLDIVHHFVMFQSDGHNTWKVLSAYQQYYAVNKAIENAHRASAASGDRRIGVIWHTTGSGKSFTMAFFTGKLIRQMMNPTIVVITDRNDLDDQLYTTFSRSAELLGQIPEQIGSRAELREKLRQRQSGGIFFTTIQKFTPDGTDAHPFLNDRSNIIVIADEAHRSQYGYEAKVVRGKDQATIKYGYARYLHDALPKASFIGFTGTPIETKDKNTPAVFGDYIDIYDMSQAIDDNSTVPIYYESRLAKLNLPEELKPKIDRDFEEITEDQEREVQEQKKTEWAQLEKVVGSQQRIQQVAEDLVKHFETRQSVMWGKAMVVCMSRRICVEMYNAITAIRPEWHDPDDTKGKIKVVMTGSAADTFEKQPHICSNPRKQLLANRMKDPKDPMEIVIVRDMWLTGFDVPFMHTMYIDKPMNGHNLIQAISRVNRVYRDKPGGLVVDYIGFAQNLKEALQEYSPRDRSRTGVDPGLALNKLRELLESIDTLLYRHDYSRFFTGTDKDKLTVLAQTTDFLVRNEDDKKRYKDLILELSTAYALCKTLDAAMEFDARVGFHKAVRAAILKLESMGKAGGKTITEVDQEINKLISRSVISEGVVDILEAIGLQKQDISILSDEFLDEIKNLPQKNLALEALRRLLNGQIRSISRQNLVQARKFSELLEAAINKYSARALDATQVILELIEIAKHVKEAVSRGDELGLSSEELAFYDALTTNRSAVELMGDQVLKQIATELATTIRNNMSVDWTVREAVQARMRVMIKKLLRKYKYPPDQTEGAVILVMEQAKQMCENESAA